MTEVRLQSMYFRRFGKSGLMVPNFRPNGWLECDIWCVTSSGYVHEVEIKLSKSDFLADRRKKLSALVPGCGGADSFVGLPSMKHDLLESGDCHPSRFSFLVPLGLVSEIDVPDWAGLIVAHPRRLEVLRRAPKLHNRKVSEDEISRARRVFYLRYWDLKKKLGK